MKRTLLTLCSVSIIALLYVGCMKNNGTTTTTDSTGTVSNTSNASSGTVAANKAAVKRFYDEVINNHNLALIDTLTDPSFVDHNPDPNQEPGIPGLDRKS